MSSILEESQKSKNIGKFKITKKKIIIFVVIILTLISSYYFFNRKESEKTTISQKEWTVKKDNLKISIESDGKVVAKDGVELSFSVSGTNLEVEEVFIKEGDKIEKGDKIATVKTENLELNVRSAYSSYLSVLADYNQTMNGATEEQIANARDTITSAEISLRQAQINLEDAQKDLNDLRDELNNEDVADTYENLVDTIKSTNISLNDILRESDEIVGVDEQYLNNAFENLLGVKNSSSLNQAKNSYSISRNELEELNFLAMLLNFNSSYEEINTAAEQTALTLEEFENHLYYMQLMLEATITSSNFSQTSLDAFVSTINSNRVSVNTKITSLNTKIEAVNDAKEDLINDKTTAERNLENSEATLTSRELSLEQSRRNYDTLIAPLTEAEKASARSRLTSASVSLERAQNELDNATITSPIDGEVARLNYKTGDIILDNNNSEPVAIIINNDTLFIEVYIEEADINKIKVDQVVYANFDALDDLKLQGEVSFISLTSKTDNNGIVTYLVRIVIIDKGDAQVREGMTAFVDFVTAEAKDILVIPVKAVRNIDDIPSVLNNDNEWIPVTTGFTDGKNVEVINGLNAGDKIIY